MPRKTGMMNLSTVSITPDQYETIKREADKRKLSIAKYVRLILSENVPDFEDDIQHGGDRTKVE